MVGLKKQNTKIILIVLSVVFGLVNPGSLTAQQLTLDHILHSSENAKDALDSITHIKNIQSFDERSVMFRQRFPKPQKGIFCIAEDKIWSASNIAFRFRLGSTNYVDWMENKTQFYNRY